MHLHGVRLLRSVLRYTATISCTRHRVHTIDARVTGPAKCRWLVFRGTDRADLPAMGRSTARATPQVRCGFNLEFGDEPTLDQAAGGIRRGPGGGARSRMRRWRRSGAAGHAAGCAVAGPGGGNSRPAGGADG